MKQRTMKNRITMNEINKPFWFQFNLVPGNLSPDLQPSSPQPKFPEKYTPHNVSKIGRYLLLEQIEGDSYKAVNWQNNEEYICKVAMML
jgi:hypothetical protein